MPDVWEFLKAVATIVGACLDLYLFYLLVKVLKRLIRFLDHKEEDRNYKQWLAREQYKNDSEKNG
ncbi:MAG: hypothetical protein HDQ98_11685 [Lachnospiraceae bacterium]|nr:hypothetical protein [Lachnospiraceae bacterium]